MLTDADRRTRERRAQERRQQTRQAEDRRSAERRSAERRRIGRPRLDDPKRMRVSVAISATDREKVLLYALSNGMPVSTLAHDIFMGEIAEWLEQCSESEIEALKAQLGLKIQK